MHVDDITPVHSIGSYRHACKITGTCMHHDKLMSRLLYLATDILHAFGKERKDILVRRKQFIHGTMIYMRTCLM